MGEGADQGGVLAGSLPPSARASAPDSWSPLMEDFDIAPKKFFFFGGEMGEGADQGGVLAGSLPPSAWASAPDSWSPLMEDFGSTSPSNSHTNSHTRQVCVPDRCARLQRTNLPVARLSLNRSQ